MILHNSEQEKTIIEGGKILASVLHEVVRAVHPGVTTASLDVFAEKLIRDAGGVPSFKDYQTPHDPFPYPATLCISVNNEVVHGLPSARVLNDGDIVGLDIGMIYQGLFTDMAMTVPVGKVSKEKSELMKVTAAALEAGIAAVRTGVRTGDVGHAIAKVARPFGYGIVRELVGHGVGLAVHEDPQLPNYGEKGKGEKLREGEVIALEPMLTLGKHHVKLAEDGWTWVTSDGSDAAHMEHTMIVRKTGAEVVTRRSNERIENREK